LRYLLANLADHKEDLPYEKLLEVDKFFLHTLKEFGDEATRAYDSYQFSKGIEANQTFLSRCLTAFIRFFLSVYQLVTLFVNDLSSFYFDICKDRLYADSLTSLERRSCQTVFVAVRQNKIVFSGVDC